MEPNFLGIVVFRLGRAPESELVMPYLLSCRDCAFQQVVPNHDNALSLKDQHLAENDEHTVEFETVEEEPMFRGGVSDEWDL